MRRHLRPTSRTRGLDGFVLRTMTNTKLAIIDRLKALRGSPASTLGTVVDAIADAALDSAALGGQEGEHDQEAVPASWRSAHRRNLTLVAPFFVTGDLDVTGTIDHIGPDSFAAVNGEVTVANLRTSGEFCCSDIHAKGIVYGDYNDNTLCCGTINARIVIADDHDIQHAGVRADFTWTSTRTRRAMARAS